jgi:uncharacterized ferritin-like protein (DUF455 family)
MELRAFAEQVLLSADLEQKLARVREPWTDRDPGPALRIDQPARPSSLQFAARRAAPAMPHPETFRDPRRRAIAHHIMANHELQALEVMAWTLLAFPAAPSEFRLGLVAIMADEQRHTTMHLERAAALGVPFGSLPVNSYIWQKSMTFATVAEYLAGLPLTFEGRNLDHTLEFEQYFLAVDDVKSAAMMRQIHKDEITHVAFGYHWLTQLKPADQSDWDAYCTSLKWPLRPEKSLGDHFSQAARRAAGLSEPFVQALQQLQLSQPQITDEA